MRRKALDIKREIFRSLSKGEKSLRELETKINTNHETIKTQVEELEFLGFVEILHKVNKKNGRKSTIVRLKHMP